jgi:hypothetical protein
VDSPSSVTSLEGGYAAPGSSDPISRAKMVAAQRHPNP